MITETTCPLAPEPRCSETVNPADVQPVPGTALLDGEADADAGSLVDAETDLPVDEAVAWLGDEAGAAAVDDPWPAGRWVEVQLVSTSAPKAASSHIRCHGRRETSRMRMTPMLLLWQA